MAAITASRRLRAVAIHESRIADSKKDLSWINVAVLRESTTATSVQIDAENSLHIRLIAEGDTVGVVSEG